MLLVPAAPAISFPAVGKLHRVTICRELRHFDQLIKRDHGGTDRRQKRTGSEVVCALPDRHRSLSKGRAGSGHSAEPLRDYAAQSP